LSQKHRPWWRRPVTFVVAGVVVVAAVAGGILIRTRANAQPTAQTVAATTTTLQQTVSASGTIASANEADLSFGSSGTVTAVDVAVGDKVTKGEALAKIDTTQLSSAVAVAQAQVDQAQAAVDAGGSTAQVTSADAQLSSAKASLSSAKAALADATLKSPITGVVAAVNIAVGDQAGSGSSSTSSSSRTGSSGGTGSTGTGTTGSTGSGSSSADISVIATDSWELDATVGSSDLGSLKKGLEATITLTGSTTPIFGTVQSIGIVAQSSSGTTTGSAQFPVVIAVTGSPGGIYSGTTATASIVVKQLQNVLVVPTLAVHTANGKTEVTVEKNGRQVATPVTVGTIFGTRTQITSGLASGAEVVVPVYTFSGTNGTTTGGTGTRGGLGGGGFGGGTGGGFGDRGGGTGGTGGTGATTQTQGGNG
jgi:multidrug efflux pump subunit AcrA (membrane-fusion protein)